MHQCTLKGKIRWPSVHRCQSAKSTVTLSHSCEGEQGRGRPPSGCWCLAVGQQFVLQLFVWKEPHPVEGSWCLAAKEILIQDPGPAIGTSWIRVFQFLGGLRLCITQTTALGGCGERRRQGPFLLSPPELPTYSASLPLSLESTAWKHVSFTLKCSFSSLSSGSSGTEWIRSLPATRVP